MPIGLGQLLALAGNATMVVPPAKPYLSEGIHTDLAIKPGSFSTLALILIHEGVTKGEVATEFTNGLRYYYAQDGAHKLLYESQSLDPAITLVRSEEDVPGGEVKPGPPEMGADAPPADDDAPGDAPGNPFAKGAAKPKGGDDEGPEYDDDDLSDEGEEDDEDPLVSYGFPDIFNLPFRTEEDEEEVELDADKVNRYHLTLACYGQILESWDKFAKHLILLVACQQVRELSISNLTKFNQMIGVMAPPPKLPTIIKYIASSMEDFFEVGGLDLGKMFEDNLFYQYHTSAASTASLVKRAMDDSASLCLFTEREIVTVEEALETPWNMVHQRLISDICIVKSMAVLECTGGLPETWYMGEKAKGRVSARRYKVIKAIIKRILDIDDDLEKLPEMQRPQVMEKLMSLLEQGLATDAENKIARPNLTPESCIEEIRRCRAADVLLKAEEATSKMRVRRQRIAQEEEAARVATGGAGTTVEGQADPNQA